MNRSASIRQNARILLGHVRGKSKAERKQIYALVAGGPLGLIAHAAGLIVASQRGTRIHLEDFNSDHEKVMQEIERGARRAMRKERTFRL